MDPAALPGSPVRYYDDQTAVVDPGGGEPFALISSATPLRAGETGDKHPIDLSLAERAGAYVSRNPVIEMALPKRLGQAVELGPIAVAFEGAGDVAATRLGDEALFYGDAYVDTDVAIAALSTGFEAFAQLRTQDSPESLTLRLALPAGVKLVDGPFGSAELRRSGEAIAWIQPPTAVDADERPVKVSMRVHGDELVVAVPHRGAGHAYPIQVDPQFQYDWAGWPFGKPANYNNIYDWQWYESNAAFYYCGPGQNCSWPGLWGNMPNGTAISSGQVARWYYRVPRFPDTTAYLAFTEFYPFTYERNGGTVTEPHLMLSLSSPNYYLGDSGYYRHRYSDVTNNYEVIQNEPPVGVPATRTDVQQANFELYTGATGYVIGTRTAYLGGARIGLTDRERPTVSYTQSGVPSSWARNASGTFNITGNDPGLGIHSLGYGLGWNEQGALVHRAGQQHPCSPGVHPTNPCPKSWSRSFGFDTSPVAQGINLAALFAEDPTGRAAQTDVAFYIDRTAPGLALSGGLTQPTPTSTTLTIDATDGTATSAAESQWPKARSGVKSVEVLVDNQRVFFEDRDPASYNQPGGANYRTWGSYDLRRTIDLGPQVSDGRHTFRVIATDFLGHPTSQTFERVIDRNPPAWISAAPESQPWTDDTLADGQTRRHQVTLRARDTGSGMKHLSVAAQDGAELDRATHPCQGTAASPCPAEFSAQLEYQLSEGLNRLEAVAEDFSGKRSQPQRWSQPIDRSKPEITLSGTLFDEPEPEAFDLDVEVTDGRATSDAPSERPKARSGVKSLELLIDGGREYFEDRDPAQYNQPGGSQYRTWGSYDLQHSFQLDPAEIGNGRHEFTVIATDFLGHETVQNFQRTIDTGPPQIVRIESSHAKRKLSPTQLESRWLSGGEVETMVFATDSGSGVERFELRLPNGQTIDADAGCASDPADGCPEYTGGTHTYLTESFPEGAVQAMALAFDDRGRSQSIAIPFKIDRADPVLNAARFEASELYDRRYVESDPLHQLPLERGRSYALEIAATDQHPQRPTAGVSSIEVLVDEPGDQGRPGSGDDLRRRAYWDQACDPGACTERSFSFDTSEYRESADPFTITTRVTDAAGNLVERSFQVKIAGPAAPDPQARTFGLEQYFAYDSTETGLAGAHVNLATGNLVWHSTPLVNPGRGLASVLNLTYNSFDHPQVEIPAAQDSRLLDLDYDEAGPGFSLGLSGITRVNEPLRFAGLDPAVPNLPLGTPSEIVMTDPDGTAHTFKLRALREPTDPDAAYEYDAPPGVNLHLRRYAPDTRLLEDNPKAWAITRPDGVTYFFDGWGMLRSIEDRNLRAVAGQRVGNQLVYEYELIALATGLPCTLADLAPLGIGELRVAPGVCEPRLARMVDAAGNDGTAPRPERSIELSYYPTDAAVAAPLRGRIHEIEDHADRVLRFEYNPAGQLAKLTQAGIPASTAETHEERDWEFTYDAASAADQHPQLASVIDPRQRATAFAYSNAGLADTPHRRAIRVTNRRNYARTYAYTGDLEAPAQPSAATVTDARSSSWAYELDSRDRQTKLTDPLGTATELAWDTDNNVVELTEAAGTGDEAKTSFAYDRSGLLLSETDPLGRTTRLSYIAHPGMHRSQMTAEGASIDADGLFVSDLIKITRPAGNSWAFTIQPASASDGGPSYTGNVTAQTDPLQHIAKASYNPDGTVLNEYDEAGDRTTYRSYDPNGLPREVIDPEGFDLEAGETDATAEQQRHRWLYGYDKVGNLTYATDPRGSAGHSPGGPAPAHFTTELSYDELDRLVAERVPKDSAAGQFITREYAYDANDNQTAIVDGEGKRWTTTYTTTDRPDLTTNPAGEQTDYVYDAEEGLTRIVSPKGVATADTGADHRTDFRLDAIGRRVLTSAVSSNQTDRWTSYAYDRRDNLIGVADPRRNVGLASDQAIANAADSARQRIAISYDAANQPIAELEDPAGAALRTEYRYDQNANRRIVLTPRGFAAGQPDPAAYAQITDYDARDMPVAEVDELGNKTSYTYTPDAKLASQTAPNGNATQTVGDFTTTYSYDENDELIERTIPWAAGQYGPRDWKVAYERNAVGDPVKVTDARGYAFANTFYDTGELKTTARPSWWALGWGSGALAPDPSIRFAVAPGGAQADTQVPVGGPGLAERTGGGASQPGAAGQSGASEPLGPGDFGRVEAEPLPPMLPAKGTTRFAYDQEMRLEAVTDNAGQSRQIAYDSTGRIAKKTWPFTATESIVHDFAYDQNGNLASFTDGEGTRSGGDRSAHTWRYSYDQFDRLTEQNAPGAQASATDTINPEITRYAYDPNSNLTGVIPPRGASYDFVYRYDALDRLTEEQGPDNARWTYGYDAASNRVSEVSPRGNVAGADPAAFETEIAYDRANRPIAFTDPHGELTEIAYDANSNRTEIAAPGASTPDDPDPQPRVTQITYDGRDLPWQTTTGAGEGEERTTVTEYDANSNLRRVVNPAGITDRLPERADDGTLSTGNLSWNATVYQYDTANLLAATYLPWSSDGSVDENGVDQGDQNEKRVRQDRAYDSRGRLQTITYPYKYFGGSDPNELKADRVCYTHYETGWIKSSTDPETVAVQRDGCEPTEAGQFAAAVEYAYDQRGHQKLWRAVGQKQDREIRRDFYPNGTLAQRSAERTRNDASGEIEPRRAYDYYYNPNRSLTEITDQRAVADPADDHRTLISRDAAERERAVDEAWAAGRDTFYGYDVAGNLTTRRVDGDWNAAAGTYSAGTTTSFTYDALERETKLTVDPAGELVAGNPETENRTTTSTYHPSGDLKQKTKAFSGVTERYSYGSDGLLERIVRDDTDDPADPGKDQRYAYDVNGNRTADERGSYDYNSRDQLVSFTPATGPDQGEKVSYVLNGSGAITRELDSAGPDTQFGYLADRLAFSEELGEPDSKTLYDYNDFASITCARLTDATPGPADCAKDSSITYTYDAFERRSGSSEEPATSYRYDGLDRRAAKLKPGESFDYAYLGTSELLAREQGSGGETKRYDYDSQGIRQGQTVGLGAGAAYRSYALDAQGSVEGLERRDGSAVSGSEYRYDPYGELQNEGQLSAEAKANPFRFQGFYYDSGVATYDMQARTYAPELNRFLGVDRYESAGADLALQSDPLTQNRYVFAGGNPVTYVEFDGHTRTTSGNPGDPDTDATQSADGTVRDAAGNTLDAGGSPTPPVAPQITEPTTPAASSVTATSPPPAAAEAAPAGSRPAEFRPEVGSLSDYEQFLDDAATAGIAAYAEDARSRLRSERTALYATLNDFDARGGMPSAAALDALKARIASLRGATDVVRVLQVGSEAVGRALPAADLVANLASGQNVVEATTRTAAATAGAATGAAAFASGCALTGVGAPAAPVCAAAGAVIGGLGGDQAGQAIAPVVADVVERVGEGLVSGPIMPPDIPSILPELP